MLRAVAVFLSGLTTLTAAGSASAAVTYVGRDIDSGTFNSSFGAQIPAATQPGDVLIATVRNNIYTSNAPGGWTPLNSETGNRTRSWWKFAVAGDAGATRTFSWSAPASWSGSVTVFRGADPAGPIGNYTSAEPSNGATIPLPNVGVVRPGSVRYSSSSSGQVGAGSFSSPGMTAIASTSGVVSLATSYEAVGPGTTAAREHQRGSAGGNPASETVILQPFIPCGDGALSLTQPGTVNFPGSTLTGLNQTIPGLTSFTVDDRTPTHAGWSLSATSTTLTRAGGQTLPEDATRITGGTASAAAGNCSLPANTVTYPLVLPAATIAPPAVKLFNAAAGTGAGPSAIDTALSLLIPADARAGTYTSTWTFTLTAGP